MLCFEFQVWFYFFSKKFLVWLISGRNYFFFAHKKKKKLKEEKERMNEVKDKNFKHSADVALNCFYIGKSL